MADFIELGIFVTLLVIGYFAGSMIERQHYASIRRREEELRDVLAFMVRFPFDRTTPPSPRGTGVYTPPAAQAPSTTASGSVASTPPMSGSSNAPSAASPGQGTGSPGASGSGTPAAATGTTPSTC